MPKLIYALILAGTLLSCQESKEATPSPAAQTDIVDKINFKNLEVASSTSKLKVSLMQEDGAQITSAKNLKPNTAYQLIVEGTQSANYLIRNNEGFDVINKRSLRGRTTYSIKTSSTLIERLYISVVPVVTEQNKLKKQASQSFLIPEN